ncbi:hypothetical protein DQM68_18740 [Leptospira mayottensis]|nr:hypothetical protein DQM68_18740 [Leptospira mayottensis]AZQ04094.1 hypothetical protein LEP1GSC190_18815 [Leptospira mayottensis 200901116]
MSICDGQWITTFPVSDSKVTFEVCTPNIVGKLYIGKWKKTFRSFFPTTYFTNESFSFRDFANC